MSQEVGESTETERNILPIEKGFPIERVNQIADKEGRAKMHYRPLTTMHKWWARRLGCVFRTICLYSLVDDPDKVTIKSSEEEINGTGSGTIQKSLTGEDSVSELINNVDMSDPDSLWELYNKDIHVEDKKILDPFMGGGTSLMEASRFGVGADGRDLNPVAWFVTKKQLEAGSTNIDELKSAFEEVENKVSSDLKQLYETPCPNCESSDDPDHFADAMYYFWVKELDCVTCGESVPLFRDYRLGNGRYNDKDKYNVFCPECESATLVEDWQNDDSKCNKCGHIFDPSSGNAGRGNYNCHNCGQKYGVVDAIQEQDGFDIRIYASEYYCPTCDEEGLEKEDYRGYRGVTDKDVENYSKAKQQWSDSGDLHEYVPDESIPLGIKTDSTKFEGSIGGGFNVIRHGYDDWTDMFNERQLFALSSLLKAIDEVQNQNAKEYLLIALSDALRTNCMMVSYDFGYNKIGDLFRDNNFNPPLSPVENNVWGTYYGRGTFQKSWDMVLSGVEWANSPVERYVDQDGNTAKSPPFSTPVGEGANIELGDARGINVSNEYDAVITDPPYYDNVIYSELSNIFYVWQKVILEDEYEGFQSEKTPMEDSIVANPAVNKGVSEFENELRQSFSTIHNALKEDGVLTFTYHHSDSESWGELLGVLCEVGFEVTAAYPITADISKLPAKLGKGDSVEFDIIIVARPAKDRNPISWNKLRRNIYRTAQATRKRLEEDRDLSRGDIGVVEMGRCFHEYSKHHGKVERAGETMTAKEVVDEIYGIIQHGSDIGEIDVFLDLLETPDPAYDDLNKLTRGTNATPKRMEDMRLYRMEDGFTLGTWDDEKRIAYIQSRVDGDEELTNLDKAQFLRYRWQHGKSISEYLDKWDITDDLRELCEGLADATGDDTYRNILESRLSDY